MVKYQTTGWVAFNGACTRAFFSFEERKIRVVSFTCNKLITKEKCATRKEFRRLKRLENRGEKNRSRKMGEIVSAFFFFFFSKGDNIATFRDCSMHHMSRA